MSALLRHLLPVAALFALSLAPVTGVRAAEGASATEQSERLLDEAHAHFTAKRYAQALPLLDRVLARSGDRPAWQARVHFFRARCLIELHRPEEARSALERFIAQSDRADDKAQGREWLAKVQRRFYGAISVRCADDRLRIALEGAAGKPRRCPARWADLRPGKYRLTITGGKAPRALSVEALAGQEVTQDLDANTRSQAPLPQPSTARWAFGAFARAGLAQARGSVADGVTVSPGLALGAGGFGQVAWPVGPVALGVRAELGYRHWAVDIEAPADAGGTAEGSSTVRTHGLALPVLFHAALPAGLALVLGPQVEFVAASDGGAQDPDVDPLAVSLVAGLAWQVPGLGDRLALSARYGLALKPAFAQADLGRDELVLGLDVRL